MNRSHDEKATGKRAGEDWPAALVLENGKVFRGRGFGARVESHGEVVFNTSLTGYQEVLTDPSYAGQIVVMTASQIGNTGFNPEDAEGAPLVCSGLVCRELSPVVSNWRAQGGGVPQLLGAASLPGIDNLDTRALTHLLRDEGAMRGAITPHVAEIPAVLARVRASPQMAGQDLVPRVTCKAPYVWTESAWRAVDDRTMEAVAPITMRVVAFDFGVKRSILRQLREAGAEVTVVPATTSPADVLALRADGVFLSNGPGDPAEVTYAIKTVAALLKHGVPTFGICLGHQILALALGAETYKLPFGHHGGNHPVKDLATGAVAITAQNHGFAVDPQSLPAGVEISHVNLYDQTVEGLVATNQPLGHRAFSVQYHPEASPGPHDSHYLFTRFRELCGQAGA